MDLNAAQKLTVQTQCLILAKFSSSFRYEMWGRTEGHDLDNTSKKFTLVF
jgi:hypothetical protein